MKNRDRNPRDGLLWQGGVEAWLLHASLHDPVQLLHPQPPPNAGELKLVPHSSPPHGLMLSFSSLSPDSLPHHPADLLEVERLSE